LQSKKYMTMKIRDIEDIKRLVDKGESATLELKKTTGQLERGMETVCAFLNGKGGTVMFGITDDKKIVGQEVEDTTKRNIASHIGEIEPAANVAVEYVNIPDSKKQVIVIHVEESRQERPFMYKGRAYMRIESTTSVMPRAVYNEMLFNKDDVKSIWESMVNPNLTIDDLDDNEILKTVRLGIEAGRLPENTGTDIPDILKRFRLESNGMLKNAAAILFAKDEMSEYMQCMVRLARFRGNDKMAFIDNKQVRGNIFYLLNESMSFVFKHLSLSGTIEGLEREEHLSIPYKAIRECIINALCHRSYRAAGTSVGIAIYDDRVEVENPGSFPADWNVENVKYEQRSLPPNPLIANVLYKRKVVENWGRGIGLMIDECVKQGLPEPEFKSEAGFVVVTFRYNSREQDSPKREQDNSKREQDNPKREQDNPKREQDDSLKGSKIETASSKERVKEILVCLTEESMNVKEIMSHLNKKSRNNIMVRYILPALENGYISLAYPDKPTHKEQKYIITSKGRAALGMKAKNM